MSVKALLYAALVYIVIVAQPLVKVRGEDEAQNRAGVGAVGGTEELDEPVVAALDLLVSDGVDGAEAADGLSLEAAVSWRGRGGPYDRDDAVRAMSKVSPLAQCIIRHESPSLNPNAVGDHGHSVGIGQIHDQGLFYLYRRWVAENYDGDEADRRNPYRSARFIDYALTQGLRSHWVGARGC